MPTPAASDWVLTASERERFNQAVTRAGLDPASAWTNQITLTASGALPPDAIQTIQVASVEDLNALIGTPNSPFQSPLAAGAARAPEDIEAGPLTATSREALVASLSAAHFQHLKISADAHVFGDSSRATANLALVNQILYPISLQVVAAQSLTLEPGATLSLDGKYVLLILGTLSIGAGAQISSTANTIVNAQVAYSAND